MMKVDAEKTRGGSEGERARERERDRESEKEREIEREEDRERERERERKRDFETYKELFCIRKSKTQLFLRLAKAKDSYFGVSEATLFETVFETQTNYKKTKNMSSLGCFETQKELFLRLTNNSS